MTDVAALIYALAGLAGLGMAVLAGLLAFGKWIDLKRAELTTRHPADGASPITASRIELADLRERLRKLEAIAAGVDL